MFKTKFIFFILLPFIQILDPQISSLSKLVSLQKLNLPISLLCNFNGAYKEYQNLNKDTMSYPEIFERAFDNNKKGVSDFTSIKIGEIECKSGQIVIEDPSLIAASEPIPFTFPRGKFSIQLAIKHLEMDERIAFARIKFSEQEVASWENLPVSADGKLRPGEGYSFSVDAGQCFIGDIDDVNLFIKEFKIDHSLWFKVFHTDFNKNYRDTWSYINEVGLFSFSAGYGDGFYTVYMGKDKSNNVCRLLIDFQLEEWE